MTWSVGVGAWKREGEVLAVISPTHLSSASPRLDQEGLRKVSS